MIRKILRFPDLVYNKIVFSLWDVVFEIPPKINGRISIGGKGKVIVGNKVTFNSSNRSNPVGAKERTSIHVAKEAVVKIGDNVGISNSLIYAWESITIENDVMVGGGCQIYDTDFHSLQYEDRVLKGDNNVKVSGCISRFRG
jgi:acetyltransferase-like isoleucine patch superfamily enzyme